MPFEILKGVTLASSSGGNFWIEQSFLDRRSSQFEELLELILVLILLPQVDQTYAAICYMLVGCIQHRVHKYPDLVCKGVPNDPWPSREWFW